MRAPSPAGEADPHDDRPGPAVRRLLGRLLGVRLCEACRLRPAETRSPFCSQPCAETFVFYD